jgi:2-aminoadipate transaminase
MSQATVYEACHTGLLDRHVPFVQATYRARRDSMLTALQDYMPADVRWSRPGGGMFAWVNLPAHVQAADLFHTALEHDVAFVPGPPLYANGGVERLSRAIQAML